MSQAAETESTGVPLFKKPTWFDYALVFLTIVVYSQGVFFTLFYGRLHLQGKTSHDLLGLLLWFLHLLFLFVLIPARKTILKALVRERFTAIFLVWAWLSLLWSQNPESTFSSLSQLLMTCLLGVWLGTVFSLLDQLKMIAAPLLALALASLVVTILDPTTGIHYDTFHSGLWQGVFIHKNQLGKFVALGIPVQLILCLEDGKRRPLWVLGVVLSTVLLYLSGSKTTMLACLAALLVLVGVWLLRADYRKLLAVLGVLLLLGGYLTWQITSKQFASTRVNRAMGVWLNRPESKGADFQYFSGRRQLWERMMEVSPTYMPLGSGYGAFWAPGEIRAEVWKALNWTPPNGHNGYLDVWVSLGPVGLMLALALLFGALWRNGRLWKQATHPLVVWPLCFLAFLITLNLAESEFLNESSVFCLLLVATASTGSESCGA